MGRTRDTFLELTSKQAADWFVNVSFDCVNNYLGFFKDLSKEKRVALDKKCFFEDLLSELVLLSNQKTSPDSPPRPLFILKEILALYPSLLKELNFKTDHPLSLSISAGNLDVFDCLLGHFDRDSLQNEKEEILTRACGYQANARYQKAVLEAVLDTSWYNKADLHEALIVAISQENLGAVLALAERGVSLGQAEDDDMDLDDMALYAASSLSATPKNLAILKNILHLPGADAIVSAGWNSAGFSPLHNAARNNNKDALVLLLEKGFRVDSQSHAHERATTPLMLAAITLSKDCLETLIAEGADGSRLNEKNENALHYLASTTVSFGSEKEEKDMEFLRPAADLLILSAAHPGQKTKTTKRRRISRFVRVSLCSVVIWKVFIPRNF